MRTIAQALASLVVARRNCIPHNPEWFERHTDAIQDIMRETAPSGSGIDAGTQIDLDGCLQFELRFTTSFHHMDENGFYDGWTDHIIVARASLLYGIEVEVIGEDRNDIHDYLAMTFRDWLLSDAPPE